MSSVTHLTQHLLKLEPAKSAARQTLFNYLKTFVDSSTPLTADLLNQFFAYVLNHHFWQTNIKLLGESVLADMETFAHHSRLDFELSNVRFPHRYQLIHLEQGADLVALINKRERAVCEEGDRLKIVPISDQQALSILLKRKGRLEVRVFGRGAWLFNGELETLRPTTELHYNSGLDLAPNYPQLLEGPLVTAARFQLTEAGCQGVMVRGHLLQRFETLSAVGLNANPELFYSLKRIEKHFVSPVSDPYYRDLANQLERAHQHLKGGQPEAIKAASVALQKGKTALKQIFSNDKLLTVLVTNLEFALMAPERNSWTPNEKI